MYVSVLFMEEGLRTVQADVDKLAAEIHTQNGVFSPSVLKEAGRFIRSILEALNVLHGLRIAHRDLKPANMLLTSSKDLVLADAGMAVFPTSLHRPRPSPGSSPQTPNMPPRSRFGSDRAAALHQRAGGTDVQRSPPVNSVRRGVVHILPTELHPIFSKQFRVRDNAGTHVFTGPEFPFARSVGTMTSADFLPGDMWAVGWILLQILSGYKAKWIQDSHSKVTLANSSPQEFWTTHLHLAGPPSTDPTVLSAIDLGAAPGRSGKAAHMPRGP
jgi:serine/threonine protein kinase